MKHFTLAFVVAALLGCGKKGDGPEKVIAKMTELKDRACSCKDKACGDASSKRCRVVSVS